MNKGGKKIFLRKMVDATKTQTSLPAKAGHKGKLSFLLLHNNIAL
jgi:hypothetical protein